MRNVKFLGIKLLMPPTPKILLLATDVYFLSFLYIIFNVIGLMPRKLRRCPLSFLIPDTISYAILFYLSLYPLCLFMLSPFDHLSKTIHSDLARSLLNSLGSSNFF